MAGIKAQKSGGTILGQSYLFAPARKIVFITLCVMRFLHAEHDKHKIFLPGQYGRFPHPLNPDRSNRLFLPLWLGEQFNRFAPLRANGRFALGWPSARCEE